MKRIGMVGLIWIGWCCAGAAQLPDDLLPLENLMDRPEELVAAVRAFDRQQVALVGWDNELAREYTDAGETLLAQDKRDSAQRRLLRVKQAYERVMNRYPNDAHANCYYGELLYDYFGDVIEGVRRWKLAVSMDTKLDKGYNNLGIHYFHYGDYDLGLACYDKALRLAPRNPDYMYNMAQAYLASYEAIAKIRKCDKTKLYYEAMKLSKKAVKAAPADFALAQDYAVNFYAAENFGIEVDWPAAAKAWQQARTLARDRTDSFYTWLNEARVWVRANDKPKALDCLKKALEIEPGSEAAKQLLADIEGQTSEGNK